MSARRRYQHRSNHKRKSAFGGTVKSHEEIRDLTKRIEAHEEAELGEFEENLEELFEKAETEPSQNQNLS